jgi:alpha-mannosidase
MSMYKMKKCLFFFLLMASLCTAAVPHTMALRSNGALSVWLVAAPLPNALATTPGKTCSGFYTDYLTATGGEAGAIPKQGDTIVLDQYKKITWQPVYTDSTGVINFYDVVGGDFTEPTVAYAFCTIHSTSTQNVVLKVGSDDAVRIWLNQDLVHDHHVHRRFQPAEDVVPVTLLPGENRLLVKVDQVGSGWAFMVSIADKNDKPMTSLSGSITLAKPIASKFYSVHMTPFSLLAKTKDGDKQKVRLQIVSAGLKNVTCRVHRADWKEPAIIRLGTLPPGKCFRDIWLPAATSTGPVQALLEAGSEKYAVEDVVMPVVRPWTVYLVQHVHTDIGYTRPQTEIIPEHLRYIDYALDFCDLTDSYPDDSKFRWTCEVSWAVREYLKYRSQQQIDRLKKRIAEGRIEVAGMFLNMSEMADEVTLAASMQPLAECKRVLNAPIVTAMQNDVNGLAWCMADYFNEAGIKYVAMGINKTRSLLPFDRPTAFWWESPSGKRVLAYRPDVYHTGNYFKIHEGKLDQFEPLLLNYLQALDKAAYPFDRIAVQFSGYFTDNSPPAMIECNLVREWNEKYISPKLRLATSREFLDYVSANHGQQLEVHRQAWPDWWSDGFGSAARETAITREMQINMQVNQGLLAMAQLLDKPLSRGVRERIEMANDALLFYDEHTFGAAESISDPMAENSMIQWGEKGSYAWEAVKRATMLREECLGLLQERIPRSQAPTIAVFNTLNWPRSGLVQVFIDHEMLPHDATFRIVDAESGESTVAQKLNSRHEGSYWAIWAKAVPALGFKCYRIITPAQAPAVALPAAKTEALLENDFYRVQIDPQTGAIASIKDKQSGFELVDSQSGRQLGQYIYEKLNGDRTSFRGKFERTSLRQVTVTPLADGPIWKSIQIKAAGDGLQEGLGFGCQVRLYETEKRLELIYSARKSPITDPEAMYIAFPFAMGHGHILYECQGGLVTPGTGQIPRSASDWQAVQNYAVIKGDQGQIVWGSTEIPLVQLGDINLGKWQEQTKIEKPHIYSWIMNNYWYTNFLAKQEGEFTWRYYLASQKEQDSAAAARFGWGSAIPLVARILPPGHSDDQKPGFVGLKEMPANLLVVCARPLFDGKGLIMQMRETAGQTARVSIAGLLPARKQIKASLVNVLDEVLQPIGEELIIGPQEMKMVKLEWE